MRFSKYHIAILALILTNVIWGAAAPILKWSLDDVPPFTLAFFRFFIASIVLLPFTIRNLRLSKKDLLYIILLAFVGFNIHIGAFLWGLSFTPSINAPIIAAAAPIFIILGSIAFLREKPKRKVIIGTLVSLLGIIVVVIRPLLEEGMNNSSIIGNLLLVIGTISFVIYTMLLKKIEGRYSILTLTFWTFAIATILFTPFAYYESLEFGSIFSYITYQGLIGILYGSILTSLVAYLAFTLALRYINASEVGIYLYLDPIVAILIAVPLLGEVITPAYILGSLLVFFGILVAEGRFQYHPFQRLRRPHP